MDIWKELIDKLIQDLQIQNFSMLGKMIEWVSHENFLDVSHKATGGFGRTVYTANWVGGYIIEWDEHNQKFIRSGTCAVALKPLYNSNNPSEDFFKEVRSTFILTSESHLFVPLLYSITKSPDIGDHMLILDYMKSGDLGSFLRKKKGTSTWTERFSLLRDISLGLEQIHENDLLHKDLHPGNILTKTGNEWEICDMGFCGPANKDSVNEIFGNLQYVASE
ncbi:24836_t:CDS:2, partial [Dentiscutata erythropus]